MSRLHSSALKTGELEHQVGGVIVPKTPPPPRLYKYQPFNAQTLTNLKRASIWFSAPINVNDPYDCAGWVIEPDKMSEAQFQQWLDYARQRDPTLTARMCPDGVPTPAFRESVVTSVRRTYDEQRTIQREQRGIACFSAHVTDIMMWSHYADGHRGFCLEFDASVPPFSNAFEVSYSDSVPSINPVAVLVNDPNDNEILRAFVLTKARCWSYEREWRLMHAEPNKLYGYGDGPLTGIYFGAEMPHTHKDIVSLITRGESVQLHEMLRDTRSFTLHSRAVKYTRDKPGPDKEE